MAKDSGTAPRPRPPLPVIVREDHGAPPGDLVGALAALLLARARVKVTGRG
jgi:hypothetical protein